MTTSTKQLIFALVWATLYTLVFIVFMPGPSRIDFLDLDTAWRTNSNGNVPSLGYWTELLIAYGWVFLLFLICTYSYVLFFTLVPIIFLSSAVVAYTETTIGSAISRDLIASVFQINMVEVSASTNKHIITWIVASLVMLALCFFHFLRLKLRHNWIEKTVIVIGFGLAFNFISTLSTYEKKYLYWRHPLDYMEYSVSFLKENISINNLMNKTDLGLVAGNAYTPPAGSTGMPLTVAFVIGESARPDHFGLYGYNRNTTPLLAKENNVIAFSDVKSCGTLTLVSVPCFMTRETPKTLGLSRQEKSFVSIFKALGFQTTWISEQAEFSGINTIVASIAKEADDVLFQENNLSHDVKKFQDLYLRGLRNKQNANLQVFHMNGSHFPYQWMYPEEFRLFTPTCSSNKIQIQDCPHEALINSYDNTIVFTDYFLNRVIDSLRDQNAIMIFVSDHGEYLGEKGKYLHGQETDDAEVRQVPMIWWASDLYKTYNPEKVQALLSHSHDTLSHDNIFHSVLDCANIRSSVIDLKLSLCQK
ncbi:MAG: Phosphoethanolamine transferase eptA [Pseudomonadota bacterium]